MPMALTVQALVDLFGYMARDVGGHSGKDSCGRSQVWGGIVSVSDRWTGAYEIILLTKKDPKRGRQPLWLAYWWMRDGEEEPFMMGTKYSQLPTNISLQWKCFRDLSRAAMHQEPYVDLEHQDILTNAITWSELRLRYCTLRISRFQRFLSEGVDGTLVWIWWIAVMSSPPESLHISFQRWEEETE